MNLTTIATHANFAPSHDAGIASASHDNSGTLDPERKQPEKRRGNEALEVVQPARSPVHELAARSAVNS